MSNWASSVVLSVTGFSRDERLHIQTLIEAAGGRYCPGLSKSCTHLLVPDAQSTYGSDKLLAAQRRQPAISIVSVHWLTDSIATRTRLSEHSYKVKLQGAFLSVVPKDASNIATIKPSPPHSKRTSSPLIKDLVGELKQINQQQQNKPSTGPKSKQNKPAEPTGHLPSAYKGISDLLHALKSIRNDQGAPPPVIEANTITDNVVASTPSHSTLQSQHFASSQPSSSVSAADYSKSRQTATTTTLITTAADDGQPVVIEEETHETRETASKEKGIFSSITVYLDPELPNDVSEACSAALQQGGIGGITSVLSLGETTHVVCESDAVLKWLSMGVGVLSPAWIIQSAKAGRLQRRISLSADCTRNLTGAAADGVYATVDVVDDKTDAVLKQELEKLLQQHGTREESTTAQQQQGYMPPSALLTNITWSVNEDPRTSAILASTSNNHQYPIIIPDSEEQQEDDEWEVSATQAAINVTLDQLHDNSTTTKTTSTKWMDEVILKSKYITVLLPRDAKGELGYDVKTFTTTSDGDTGLLTYSDLLMGIYSYYQEAIPLREQLDLYKMHSNTASELIKLIKSCNESGERLYRYRVLQPRFSLEGLYKVTRGDVCGSIPVYELRLAC